jgi:hypothetical protein
MLRRHPLADAAETDSDDLELVRQIQNGDREALESLVRRHQDWVYNIALRMVYLPEDAEERDLHSFMHEQCGLVNKANPCHCAKKTRAFMQAGYVNPQNLLFAATHVTRAREVSRRVHQDINELDAACAEIHRDHPFHAAPDFVKALRDLLDQLKFRSIL